MTKESQTDGNEVQRATGYVRLHADGAMAFPIGRDIEIVFMENSPLLHEYNEDDSDSSETKSTYKAETRRLIAGHVRISGGTAISLALDILEEAAEMAPIRKDRVGQRISEILALYGPTNAKVADE